MIIQFYVQLCIVYTFSLNFFLHNIHDVHYVYIGSEIARGEIYALYLYAYNERILN